MCVSDDRVEYLAAREHRSEIVLDDLFEVSRNTDEGMKGGFFPLSPYEDAANEERVVKVSQLTTSWKH